MHQKLLSTLAITTTVLAGFVSATTPGLERESCIVSDTVYDQVAAMQIQYTDELTAEQYDTAQTIYDEMQTLITTSCGNTDGIVSLQTVKTELKKKDYYGEYIVNRNYFPGKQAGW